MPDGERLVFGFMTGTSIDALDGSAVRIRAQGLSIRAEPVRHVTVPLGGLATRLRAVADGQPHSAAELGAVAREFSLLHASAARELASTAGRPDLIAVHGQTVHHAPPVSWQLFNPAPLASELNARVVHDLRAADLAHGGQGAPITPLADWVLFRSSEESRAVINLGGFCNVTILPTGAPPEGVCGFDVCACNHVLDEVARRALRAPYDAGGESAAAGTAHPEAAEQLQAALTAQRAERRSLGSGDETYAWVREWGGRIAHGPDLAASAVEAVALAIAGALAPHAPQRLIVAGGGAHHRGLVGAIARHTGRPVEPSNRHGVPIAHREAVAMAVLGAMCEDRMPITLPQVTGVAGPAPLSGCFTQAPHPV